MQIKSLKILAAIAVTILMMCGSAFAGSQTTNPTLKYTDTTTPAKVEANPFLVTEVGADGFNAGGYFRLVIPSSVSLQSNLTTALTRNTTTLGEKDTPKSLYVEQLTGTSGKIFLDVNGTNFGLLTIYGSAATTAATYGSSDTNSNTAAASVAKWSDATALGYISTTGSSAKVGEIYYDDTTQETVITLAGASLTTASSKLWFNALYLKPVTAGSTGTVNVSILDKNADGNNPFGVTDDTTVKVLTLTDQPVSVSGSTTPPTIPAGKVAGQPNGKIDMTFVGAAAADDNKITISLDNGAKFHAGAAGTSVLGNSITVASTAWNTWHTAYPTSDLSVNSAGALVITLGTHDIADAGKVIVPATIKAVIDTSGVTTAGDINATIVGSGTDLAKLNKSVKIATVALTGATASFSDDTTAGLTTIYAGRTAQTISESLLIGENAPGSLLSGGLIQMDLNLGAKFTASDSITATEYTTSPYAATSGLTLSTPAAAATASSTYKATVTGSSSTSRGAYKIGSFSFDLSNASAGALQMTVSGNAGAAGTVTMATVVNATDTSVASPATLIPGSSAVALPDIVITENHYGALVAAVGTKDIVIHFPSAVTLDQTATVTVTSVAKTSGTSSTTAVTKQSIGSQDLYLDVATASTSTSGPYTITIKGLVADISSSIGSGSTSFIITGTDNTLYGASGSHQGSNYGAMPTAQTVAFGTVVSSTVPFAGTPVVSGTAVTQTFIPAGNDINKSGDVYVFTSGQYYTGTAWSATEAAYKTGETLDKMSITYDVNGLPTSSKIYIGYGVGMTGTFATMNSNATFVMAYTTPSSVETGTKAGDTKVSFNVKDDIELNLNITNDDGVDTANIKQEWLVFGATANGIDAGLFFFDGTNVVPYTDGMDLTTVTYKFDHSKDYIKVSTLNMDALGLQSGDTFWYGYVYSENGIDLADPTTYSLENIVTITAK